jgi:hypothetical protein
LIVSRNCYRLGIAHAVPERPATVSVDPKAVPIVKAGIWSISIRVAVLLVGSADDYEVPEILT